MTTTHCDWFHASDFHVLEAREYYDVKSNAKKQPYILLKNKRNHRRYAITDRMVLFGLLKRLDSDLTYSEFMQTVYDAMGHRPPLDVIIDGYLWSKEGEPEDIIDLHYRITSILPYDIITHVDSNDSQSLYYRSTYDFISANFLPHYLQLGEPKIIMQNGLEVPYMRFGSDKSGDGQDCGTIIINILSHRNSTYITGTIEIDGKKMQPVPMETIKGWTHLVEATTLRNVLTRFENALNSAVVMIEEKITNEYDDWQKRHKMMSGSSDRVRDFVNRNRLERENWELVTY